MPVRKQNHAFQKALQGASLLNACHFINTHCRAFSFAGPNTRQRFMWANELTIAKSLLRSFSGMKR
jgi:hypothetical protein